MENTIVKNEVTGTNAIVELLRFNKEYLEEDYSTIMELVYEDNILIDINGDNTDIITEVLSIPSLHTNKYYNYIVEEELIGNISESTDVEYVELGVNIGIEEGLEEYGELLVYITYYKEEGYKFSIVSSEDDMYYILDENLIVRRMGIIHGDIQPLRVISQLVTLFKLKFL